MNFLSFKSAVAGKFAEMAKSNNLFVSSATKDLMWEIYLKSFPEGSDPIYRERSEHDCNCCKQFIRNVGNVVMIDDNNKITSIWDVIIEGEENSPYQVVANALSKYVTSCEIENVFLSEEKTAGTDKNYEEREGKIKTWNHFFVNIPNSFVVKPGEKASTLSDIRASRDVLFRGLSEITDDSLDTVLELISQNSLYRGEENEFAVKEFKKLKTKFSKLKTTEEKICFVWSCVKNKTIPVSVIRIRNTSIGTLLVDLSSGLDLEESVKSFESKVAPMNYKRPTSIITKSMIENAKKVLDELGLTSALERRYAKLNDITVNNILFVDRNAKKYMKDRVDNVFDELSETTNPKNFGKIEEISIEKFLKDVLPTTNSMEILLKNSHQKNLVSLITSVDPTSNKLFKWNNNFSWSYTGDMTDSIIKERVKNAGGSIEGVLCCRLSWFNFDDLDFHMKEPGGYEIYFSNKMQKSPCGGMLDVDMNAGHGETKEPVENIFYSDSMSLKEGIYTLIVHNYSKRETDNVGFEVEVDIMGDLKTMRYNKAVPNNKSVQVMKLEYKKASGFKILSSLESEDVSKEFYGIKTNQFHKVNVLMTSPNFWDDQIGIGNKHYFFMIDGCKNPDKARGFYNEFFKPELDKHRKVFEVVGNKMKTDYTDEQLSGVGFSSTQKNDVTLRITGKTKRIIKVVF